MPVAASPTPAVAQSDDAQANLQQWQLRRLNQPSERELAQEQEGKVYVYDGLTDRQVDRALDANFPRIEHMMFIGTVKTDAKGEALKDDQGHAVAESPGCH
jgi:hypothetical protein